MDDEAPTFPEDDATAWISDVVQSIASLPEVRDRVITDEDIDKIARSLHRSPSYVRRAPRKDLLFLIYHIDQAEARVGKKNRSRPASGD
ncbi:MAG TPA: hypothetical protein HA263_04120 [Methanoregulaceae archaeon]|nr:hypothetical protein [Methanoregulaceae archaeon]